MLIECTPVSHFAVLYFAVSHFEWTPEKILQRRHRLKTVNISSSNKNALHSAQVDRDNIGKEGLQNR